MIPEKKPRLRFTDIKDAATSPDPLVRKRMFEEYFERFEEFPSYLFDNEHGVDSRLRETIADLQKDPNTSKAMQRGIEALIMRLRAF